MTESEESQKANYGYFTKLNVRFTSSVQQIERNYQKLRQFYQETASEATLCNLQRVCDAYYMLTDLDSRQEYMQALIIRAYLSQQSEAHSRRDGHRLWPFFIFEVFRQAKSNSQIMQFNFVTQTLTEQIKDSVVKAHVFSNIQSALYSNRENEFIINFVDNGKINSCQYRVKFQLQRDLIVRLAILAKEIFEETKPTLEFHNPNTKQNLSLFKVQHFSIGDQVSIPHSSQLAQLNFHWDDADIPPMAIFKSKAFKVPLIQLGQEKQIFITLGKMQMIISRDIDVQRIVAVVPLKKECITFSREENLVSCDIVGKQNTYRFPDKTTASSFILKLNMILNQKAQVSNLVTERPLDNNIQQVAKKQKDAIHEINMQIAQYEQKISSLKFQRQLLYSEISEAFFDEY